MPVLQRRFCCVNFRTSQTGQEFAEPLLHRLLASQAHRQWPVPAQQFHSSASKSGPRQVHQPNTHGQAYAGHSRNASVHDGPARCPITLARNGLVPQFSLRKSTARASRCCCHQFHQSTSPVSRQHRPKVAGFSPFLGLVEQGRLSPQLAPVRVRPEVGLVQRTIPELLVRRFLQGSCSTARRPPASPTP